MYCWTRAIGCLGWIATLFLMAIPAYAAKDTLPGTVRLEEVVVTATRMEQEASQSPAAVSIVKKEEMEKRGVKTFDQAVNETPGVFNRRGKSFMDTQAAVTLRGIPDQKRTLILLDGITLNDPRVGTVNFGGLAPEDLERVEVARGPFSSLYGGNAMGGVVQYLTKWPEKREVVLKTGFGTAWHGGEAPENLWRSYASYGDRVGKWRWFISLGSEQTDGYVTDHNVVSTRPTTGITGWRPTTSNKGELRYLIGDRGDNGWSDYHGTAKLRYDFSPGSRLLVQFLRTSYDYTAENPHTYLLNNAFVPVYSYTGVKEASFLSGYGHRAQNIYNLTWEQRLGPVEGKLSLGLNDQNDAWYVSVNSSSTATQYYGPGSKAETPSKGYNADLQFTIPVLKKHRLIVGGSFRYDTAETKEFAMTNWGDLGSTANMTYESKGKGKTYAVFVQGEVNLLDNLTLYAGFRGDWWETFDGYANSVGTAGYPEYYNSRSDSAFSPKGSIVYRPISGTALRLSAGNAFRAPTIYELYRTYTSGVNTYRYNPYLSPEKAFSWEAGVEQHLWKGAVVKATYFENSIKDLIYQGTVGPNLYQNMNAGRAEGSGIEIEIEQRVDKWLRLFANYTYVDTRITENAANQNSIGKLVPQVPRETFNAGAAATLGRFDLSLTGRYVGRRFSSDDNSDVVNGGYGSRESFFTADGKISCRVVSWATVSISVDNILDRTCYDYYRAPGRSWFTEVTFHFD